VNRVLTTLHEWPRPAGPRRDCEPRSRSAAMLRRRHFCPRDMNPLHALHPLGTRALRPGLLGQTCALCRTFGFVSGVGFASSFGLGVESCTRVQSSSGPPPSRSNSRGAFATAAIVRIVRPTVRLMVPRAAMLLRGGDNLVRPQSIGLSIHVAIVAAPAGTVRIR